MLLAAGEGKRLRPLTEDLPKPMLRIGGRPVLEYNVRLMAQFGIRDLVINLHHCPKAITDYFGNGERWGVSITYSYEPELVGTAGAVRRVAHLFQGSFLVMYGDNITTCNLARMFAFHRDKGGVGTIAVYRREDVTTSGMVQVDGSGRIISFREKPRPEEIFSHWVNAGVLVLEPRVMDHIPAGQFADFGNDILPNLIELGIPIFGYPMSEQLWWLDSLSDYEKLQSLVEQGEVELP